MALVGKPSITVATSYETTQGEPGPFVTKYRAHSDLAGVFQFVAEDASTDDGVTTLAPTGGTSGRWLLVGQHDRGTALTDATATIHVTGGLWRTLPAATLTANRVLTLGTTNAREGYVLLVTRLDATAYTLAIANGGAGGGTLVTLPVSVRSWARFWFDGTDWLLRDAAAMPS